MFERSLGRVLQAAAGRFPVVTLTGPRQSGKTTLVRAVFPRHRYLSLELPDTRAFALSDPRGFLGGLKGPAILDEAQRAPELFSYIQAAVDENGRPGRFILTGSQNFLLMQAISQSLAGRASVLHLLPFSLAELARRRPLSLQSLGTRPASGALPDRDLFSILFTGFYPRIHDKRIPAQEWLAGYHQTYLERDVRTLVNVGDLETFGRFVRLCAGRCGQILNLSSLASDCGVTHTTARRWISILETSFILMLLRPYHRNFNKRMIKSPKIYFLDTGLLCFLLRIRSPEDLETHALRGAVFETFVLSELLKGFLHRGQPPALSFWRDSTGTEIDFVVEAGGKVIAVEAKSGKTVTADSLRGLVAWRTLTGDPVSPAALVYGGDEAMMRNGISITPWYAV